MSENKKDLVNIIRNIKKGKTYGLSIDGFSSYTNSNLSGLLEAITRKDELEAFPDFVGEYIQSKELEILLSKNIIDSDGKTKNALSFLPYDFCLKINKNLFLELPNEYLQLILPEQLNLLPKEIVMQLAKSNKLQFLSNEAIENIGKNLDLYHKLSANIASGRLTEKELKTQLNSLIETKKLQYLPKESIGTITDEVINSFGANFIKLLNSETIDYLATINGDGALTANKKICSLNINSIPVENFKKLKKETIAVLTPEQINTLDHEHLTVLKENIELINILGNNFANLKDISNVDISLLNNTIIGRITNDQFKQLDIEQFKALCDTNKFKYLKSDIIEQISDEYLLYAVEHGGLNVEQAKYITKEQFKTIYKKNENNISSEIISGLKSDIISESPEFLKNLNVKQAKSLNQEQINSITKAGHLSVLPKNVLSQIQEKINLSIAPNGEITRLSKSGKLEVLSSTIKNLNVTQLTNEELKIIKQTNFFIQDINDISSSDKNPILDKSLTDITKYNSETPNNVELSDIINKGIQEGDWQELKERIVKLYSKKDTQLTKYLSKTLDEKIANTEWGVFGYADKIELLKMKLLIVNNPNDVKKVYSDLTSSVRNLINIPSISHYESVSKINSLLSIASDPNFSANLREGVFRQLTTMLDMFEKKNFSDKDITPSNAMLNLRRNVYANYMDFLINRYPEISRNNISVTNDSDLSFAEREFKKSMEKINIDNGMLNEIKSSVGKYRTLGIGAFKKFLLCQFSADRGITGMAYKTAAAKTIKEEFDDNNHLNKALKFDKKVINNERKKPVSIFGRILRAFKRLRNLPIKRITVYQKREDIDAIIFNSRSKNDVKNALVKQLEDNKKLRMNEIIKTFETNGITQKDNCINLRIQLANMKMAAIEEKTNRKKLNLNNLPVTTDPGTDAIKKKIAIQEIESKAKEKIDKIRYQLCNELLSKNEENKQKFDSFMKQVEVRRNNLDNIYGQEHSELQKGLLPIVNKIKKDKEVLLDSDITEALVVSVKSSLEDDNVSLKVKENNIKTLNEILAEKGEKGVLNLQDPEVAKNISTILTVMNSFITTQLTAACVFAAATEATKQQKLKQQELQKEQARINDMQAKIQENGVNPLVPDDRQTVLAF